MLNRESLSRLIHDSLFTIDTLQFVDTSAGTSMLYLRILL